MKYDNKMLYFKCLEELHYLIMGIQYYQNVTEAHTNSKIKIVYN